MLTVLLLTKNTDLTGNLFQLLHPI